jgi:hypothetical protein
MCPPTRGDRVVRLSDEQRRVLKALRRGPKSAKEMRTGIRTLIALSKNGLVYVPCTFNNIAFPQKAAAEITDDGKAAIALRH